MLNDNLTVFAYSMVIVSIIVSVLTLSIPIGLFGGTGFLALGLMSEHFPAFKQPYKGKHV